MARTNGPIQVWNSNDSTPSDSQGGYAGGDSTAAALAKIGADAAASAPTSSLPNGADDANNWQTTQPRLAWASHSVTNTPDISKNWRIDVTRFSETSILQVAYGLGVAAEQYMRWRGSSNWTAWTRIDAAAAVAAMQPISSTPTTDANADTWQTSSTRFAWASHNVTNTPDPAVNWSIEVKRLGSTSILQTATSFGTNPQVWVRWRGSSNWTAWTRIDAGGMDATIDTKVSSATANINPAIVGAPQWRTLPLVLTAGGGGATWSTTSGGLRHRFRVPTEVLRWRVHVRDINPRFGIVQTSDLTISGVWVGPQGTTPGRWTTAPTKVDDGGTATGGSEWVSKWISAPLTADTWHTLGLSWSSTAAPQATRTTAWTTAQGDTATPGATTTQTTAPPFDMWLECEVPATMPAVAFLTDSLGVGIGSTYGVTDAWGAQLAQTQRFWPILMGHSGDTLANWTTPTAYKWTRFAGTSKPDAVVLALASNDIFGAATLATVQGNAQTVAGIARDRLASALYLTSILPRENVSGAIEDTRRAYNTWLSGLPMGGRERIDIVPAVSADDETLRDEYDADGTHLNTAGYAAIAAAFPRALAPKRAGTATGQAVLDAPTAADARAAIGAAEQFDTGWRDITTAGVLLNGWTATSIKIRRVGERVTLRVTGLSSSSATGDGWLQPPGGFRLISGTVPMIVGATLVPIRSDGGGAFLSPRPVTADARAAEVSWMCDQARPATPYPGVAA